MVNCYANSVYILFANMVKSLVFMINGDKLINGENNSN